MDDQAIRAALERHGSDIADQDVTHEIYHDDVVLEFPQARERIAGLANVRAMREAYPVDLAMTIERIRGGGDLWVAENDIVLDGMQMHTIHLLELSGGKVIHETIYFADRSDTPTWRAPWSEKMAPGTA